MSLRNVSKSQQRTHKERSQIESRQNLGILEKKKDYKLRAKDFQEKRNAIRLLRQKALNKNPDEFYFHMVNSNLEDGVHTEEEKAVEISDSQRKLMRSQDLNYVKMKHRMETKKIDKLQSNLHMTDHVSSAKKQHIFFVDSKKEAKTFDLASRLDTYEELIQSTPYNMLRKSDLTKLKLKANVTEDDLKTITKQREQAYKELVTRMDRAKELRITEQRLNLTRSLAQDKTNARLVDAGGKDRAPVYRWRMERKK